MTYDYKKAVKQDVKAYVRDNICLQDFDDVDELRIICAVSCEERQRYRRRSGFVHR